MKILLENKDINVIHKYISFYACGLFILCYWVLTLDTQKR